MPDLSTKYLGLTLKNPLVVAASPLSEKKETLQRLEAAGASAVVLFSLFAEQIELAELGHQDYYKTHPDALPPELQQVAKIRGLKFGANQYLAHIFQLKKALDIPVIASLNGYYSSGWTHYARILEGAGADALEINVYYVEPKPHIKAQEIEHMYLEMVRQIKQEIKIPVALKISPYFSAMANMVHAFDKAGADGLVLFNRFYQPDFDIEHENIVPSLDLSTPAELRLRLRWTAMLYEQIQADIAITGGVHTAVDVVKSIMAGATVVQMASALLKNGVDHLGTVKNDLETWLDSHEYASINALRGKLSLQTIGDSAILERANYINVLKSYES